MLTLVVCPILVGKDIFFKQSKYSEIEEFSELSKAIESIVVHSVVSLKINKINVSSFFGKGKISEFKSIIDECQIKLLLTNCKLSPIQQRNLEKVLQLKVLDRTGLILEIFGDRAQTKEGVLQVDLAHLEYQKTRLVRSWTHLERQRGGIGFMGGPGETQIESDRRAINEKIVRIKKSLDKVIVTRRLQRVHRRKKNIPVIALVGYTNTGKSTIFNYLTKANVFEKDMLFATLDPKMRLLKLPGSEKVILLDTVGFISDLPTHLISAFRGTLEEVINADIILHVRDVSHKENRRQVHDVENTLNKLNWNNKKRPPTIEVYNKIDKLDFNAAVGIADIKGNTQNAVFLSAKQGDGFECLHKKIKKLLRSGDTTEEIFVKFCDQKLRAWLFEKTIVNDEKILKKGFLIKVSWSKDQRLQFRNLI
ncbi:MAG: GTPase HflX [Paracoccaceae bacterium]|nr:GTPase HflX [Paracoccaceae bacterium]